MSAAGWTEWHGGDCPLELGQSFDAKLRDGRIFTNQMWGLWDHAGLNSDIVAYRVIPALSREDIDHGS